MIYDSKDIENTLPRVLILTMMSKLWKSMEWFEIEKNCTSQERIMTFP